MDLITALRDKNMDSEMLGHINGLLMLGLSYAVVSGNEFKKQYRRSLLELIPNELFDNFIIYANGAGVKAKYNRGNDAYEEDLGYTKALTPSQMPVIAAIEMLKVIWEEIIRRLREKRRLLEEADYDGLKAEILEAAGKEEIQEANKSFLTLCNLDVFALIMKDMDRILRHLHEVLVSNPQDKEEKGYRANVEEQLNPLNSEDYLKGKGNWPFVDPRHAIDGKRLVQATLKPLYPSRKKLASKEASSREILGEIVRKAVAKINETLTEGALAVKEGGTTSIDVLRNDANKAAAAADLIRELNLRDEPSLLIAIDDEMSPSGVGFPFLTVAGITVISGEKTADGQRRKYSRQDEEQIRAVWFWTKDAGLGVEVEATKKLFYLLEELYGQEVFKLLDGKNPMPAIRRLKEELENKIGMTGENSSSPAAEYVRSYSRYNIGISIGGSKFKLGIVDIKGNVFSGNEFNWRERLAGSCDDPSDIIGLLIDEIDCLLKAYPLSVQEIGCVGIAWPGPVDNDKNTVTASFLPFNQHPLEEEFNKAFKRKYNKDINTVVIMDTYADVGGELKGGLLRGKKNGVVINLATGVGAGVLRSGMIIDSIKLKGINIRSGLGLIGRHLVREKEDIFSWEYRPTLEGGVANFNESEEVRFAMSCGGPYIAARYIREAADRFAAQSGSFIPISGMFLGGIRDALEAGFNKRTAQVVNLEKEVLRGIGLRAKEIGCEFSRNFIAMIGKEIGSALGVFLGTYKGYLNLDSCDIILVGSIGQKFGLNILDGKGKEVFLANIKEGIYQKSGIILAVVRSGMDADRAILAFCPADSIGALIQAAASSSPLASGTLGAVVNTRSTETQGASSSVICALGLLDERFIIDSAKTGYSLNGFMGNMLSSRHLAGILNKGPPEQSADNSSTVDAVSAQGLIFSEDSAQTVMKVLKEHNYMRTALAPSSKPSASPVVSGIIRQLKEAAAKLNVPAGMGILVGIAIIAAKGWINSDYTADDGLLLPFVLTCERMYYSDELTKQRQEEAVNEERAEEIAQEIKESVEKQGELLDEVAEALTEEGEELETEITDNEKHNIKDVTLRAVVRYLQSGRKNKNFEEVTRVVAGDLQKVLSRDNVEKVERVLGKEKVNDALKKFMTRQRKIFKRRQKKARTGLRVQRARAIAYDCFGKKWLGSLNI